MKILFFISIHRPGLGMGGHFHSLNHISRELGIKHEVKIVTIGCKYSPILVSNPHFLKHYEFNGLNTLGLYKYIKIIMLQFKPDIYHFFDYSSYNVLRLLIGSKRHKVIMNKCGGPNYKWPFVNNFILFSQENYDWYKADKKFKDAQIHLIPNRVQKIRIDNSFKPIIKNTDSFNFVRICRIGIKYKKTIQDSINLILYLHKRGCVNTKLFIIGAIEDQLIFSELKNTIKNMGGVITLLTENQYTKEASKMLYLADACIGTGRGFMEASSIGIPLLSFNADDDYPILITEKNFADVFKTNFSERNRIQEFNSVENLINIEKMVKEKNYYIHLSEFSVACFNKHFNVDVVLKEYTEVYANAEFGSNKYLRDIRSILGSFKSFYSSYRLEKKQ